jgi:hypothetical protein
MSTQQHGSWDDDEEPDEEQQGQDSTAMRELRKADRAKAKRIAELETQLASLSGAERQRTVKDVLQARNLNPKIASFIPADVEPTEDALGKWLDEYVDVFGGAQEAAPSEEEAQATLAQLRQVDALASGLKVPAGAGDLEARIASVQTKEELDALIFGGGAGR